MSLIEVKVPDIGDFKNIPVIEVLVKPGDSVTKEAPLITLESDKATMEVPSPFAGTIVSLQATPGKTIKVGQSVLSFTPAGTAAPAAETAETAPVAAANVRSKSRSRASVLGNGPSERGAGLPVKAAPSVRQMARKLGIDLAAVQGSGPEGRVLIDDLTNHLQRAGALASPATTPAPRKPDFDYGKPGTRVPLVGLRRKIAEHMVKSKQTIPHYSYIDECDVTDLVRLRDALRENYAQDGIKLTYLAFVVKAVVAALKEVPIVNATLDEADGVIVLHDRYDVGIAVATAGGLIVPVIRDADRKSLGQIAGEIERLGGVARANRLRREELRGGTFTITSVGNLGGLISTPVINHPEVGILGIGKIIKRPVFDAAGVIKPADLLYLSFSFDHRVVDGAVGAVFGNAVLQQLQNPARLLLPEKLGD